MPPTAKPKLVELSIDAIPVGSPLQFALRATNGALLANRGYTIETREHLERLSQRGVGLVELMLHLHRANAVVNTTSLALLPLDAVYSGAWQEEHAGRSPMADVQWRFEERLQAAADQSGPLAVVMGEVNEGIAYQVLAACFGTPSVVVGVRKS